MRSGRRWQLAVRGDGRFAAVTNLRDLHNGPPPSGVRAANWCVTLSAASSRPNAGWTRFDGSTYAPFNLIVGDAEGVRVLDGRLGEHHRLAPGLHAISNGPIHEDWPNAAHPRIGERCWARALIHPPCWSCWATNSRRRMIGCQIPAWAGTRTPAVLDLHRGTGWHPRQHLAGYRQDGSIDLHEASFGPDGVRGGVVRWRHVPDAG